MKIKCTESREIGVKEAKIRAGIEIALILLGLLEIWFLLPHQISGDGTDRWQDMSNLLYLHKLYDPGSRYSLVGPLFSLPLWILGHSASNFIDMYNPCLFIISLGLVYLLLKDRLEPALLRKFFLILIAASMFPAHLTNYYGEVFTALCFGFGAFALVSRTTHWLGWSAIVLAVVNTPATVGGLCLFLLKYIMDHKRLRYILCLVIVGLLIMGESWLRRGSPLNQGYSGDAGFPTVMPYTGISGFSYPFFFGVLSILFSFGKGLFFFMPGLLLPVRKTLLQIQQEKQYPIYHVYLWWMGFVIGLVLIYARWWAWYGGLFWGPRFFLMAAIPASFALAVRLHRRDASLFVHLLTLVVLGLSCWVGLDGALWEQASSRITTCTQNSYALEFLCHYTPEFSALWYPFVKGFSIVGLQWLVLLYSLCLFLYLAQPLCLTIVKQVGTPWQQLSSEHFNLKGWRF
ncbi:hypothetical protein [Tengunoibacter tsumagoiensis]|uniref:Glycosyltransferase RgtA/B/C/D-like domain-containing protein n=1 Tax=Tengunoibacter tsumagoiensis TaxID=2014871 RepID=A0A402A431_9CHLR|nr:hypothetical protein [Tengunoibacter tsumagoiensis]GCE13917.1 hypothetical protein KTT_37760 [Tengunoibacter tsumagoiensis]